MHKNRNVFLIKQGWHFALRAGRLKVIPWDAFTSERSLGRNCEVIIKYDVWSVILAIEITVESVEETQYPKCSTTFTTRTSRGIYFWTQLV